jgi:hypothetical protein
MHGSSDAPESKNVGGAPPPVAVSPAPKQILAELQLILQAPSFRTSRRSQQFLKYVIDQALADAAENLKERAIGMALFDRHPDYDTSEDAAVRVAAGEVRKRLAQYYVESRPEHVRIDLPPGCYTPEFIPVHPPARETEPAPAAAPAPLPETVPPKRAVRRGRLAASAFLALALAVTASFLFLGRSRPTPFNEFWQPILDARQPVVVCLTHPVVYLPSERLRSELVSRKGIDPLGGPYVLDIPPHNLRPGDLVPSTDQYVGSGDAYAASHFMALFSRNNKPAQLRIGQDVSFADLRAGPAVLIGAYSNRWAMQANRDYRFSFRHRSVLDRQNPHKEYKVAQVTPDYKGNEDYAIVSRVFQSYTGQFTIASAGVTNAGTQAAAELLTNPARLNAALSDAPAGWQKRNLQILLHCRVIGSTPGPPEVVGVHSW